jgi:GNAT superfamily N-acetyltransferase
LSAAADNLIQALANALAVDRAIRRRGAATAIHVPGGLVVRHPELADVHHLNAIVLNAAASLDADALTMLADQWLGDLGHRHVVLDDAAAGERLAAELADAGWGRGRTEFMAFTGDPAAVSTDARARQISETEMRALQLAALREEASVADARSGLPARLAAAQSALRAGTPARCFAAGEGGEPQSMGTLFLDADVNGRRVAMVEEVGTLSAHRGRGLARAVVSAAVAAAHAWNAELIVVPVDADDWPQLMYARLGFAACDPPARQVSLTWRGQAAGWAGSESVSGAV